MKRTTLRNIIFSILGALLLGIGWDMGIYTLGTTGIILMIISLALTIGDLTE